jgi:WD40 repeat protein
VIEGCEQDVTAIGITPDGRCALSGGRSGESRIWRLADGACVSSHSISTYDGEITSISISPDGQFAACSSRDSTLFAWRVPTLTKHMTFSGHEGVVNTVAITPDGRRLVSGSTDKTIRVWDIKPGDCLALCALEAAVLSVALTKRGMLAGLSSGCLIELLTAHLWDGSPLLTATRKWVQRRRQGLFSLSGVSHGWADHLSVTCPYCNRTLRVQMSPKQVSVEASCVCTNCQQILRLNPSVCDPSGWELSSQ